MIMKKQNQLDRLKNAIAEQCIRNNINWEYLINRAIDNEAYQCQEYWEGMTDSWNGELNDEDYMHWERAFVANFQLRKFYNSVWGYDCKDTPPKPPKQRTLEATKRYYENDNRKFPPWSGFIKERNEAYKGEFRVLKDRKVR